MNIVIKHVCGCNVGYPKPSEDSAYTGEIVAFMRQISKLPCPKCNDKYAVRIVAKPAKIA